MKESVGAAEEAGASELAMFVMRATHQSRITMSLLALPGKLLTMIINTV